MKKLIILLLVSNQFAAFCQYRELPASGIIEYEKSVNTHAVFKKHMIAEDTRMTQLRVESYLSKYPQFKILKSSLAFSRDETLFTPIAGYIDPFDVLAGHPYVDQINTVYTNQKNRAAVTEKRAFDQTFLVKDSVRKIDWKITSETREVAGYTCRRANAIIMDSVYVVAFYTGEIPVPSGPESFTGLPGMILEVVLPHENIRWYANKVSLQNTTQAAIAPPTKGKVVTSKELTRIFNEALKDRPKHATVYMKGLGI